MDTNVTEMALPPHGRRGVFQLAFFTDSAHQELISQFPNSQGFGSGLNHQSKNLPNYEIEIWAENAIKLKDMKRKLDPDNRFNCYQCIGYIDSSSSSVGLMFYVPLFFLKLFL